MAEEATNTLDEETLDTQEPLVDDPSGSPEVAVDDSGDGSTNTGAEPGFSAETLQLAERYGFDPTDFASEQAIRKAAEFYDRQFEAWQRQQAQQQPQRQSNDPATGQAPAQSPQPASPFDLDKLLPKDNYDEGLIGALKTLHGHYDERLKPLSTMQERYEALEQHVQALVAQRQHEDARKFESEMDDWFGKVADTHKARFGSGRLSELRMPSHKEARMQVVTEMHRLADVDHRAGRPLLSSTQYADRALHILFGNDNKAIARTEIVKELAGRKNAALPGANGKHAKPLSGEAKAWDTYKRKADAMGLKVNDDE